MSEYGLTDYVAAANAALTDPRRNRTVGTAGSRFELYHSALSVGSHKARITLFEKDAGWISHDLDTLPPRMENYHPDYVRLRLQGKRDPLAADGYGGRSSSAAESFDPCAVPTLVDHDDGAVLVDAKPICEHLARECPGGRELYPARLESDIDRQAALVDRLPLAAVLYGAHPDGDFRPARLRRDMPGAQQFKIIKLMESRSLAVGRPPLTAAFDAKIRHAAEAGSPGADPARVRAATDEIVAAVAALDGQLGDGRQWVCGQDFTLADVHWAACLFRLQWLGMGFCWTGRRRLDASPREHVARYARRLFERPSVRRGLIHWPGNPPSEFVQEYYRAADGAHGRDIREDSLTDAVLASMAGAGSARARTVLNAFARHLHAFLEEIEPSETEWEWAIDWLTRTGHLCKDGRQEFVLLSDVMGATARVDLINHRLPAGATENSVLGPFFVEPRPAFENGADIAAGMRGEPLLFSCRVLDTDGRPLAGARVDIWHADGVGAYDVMMPERRGKAAGRGLFRADRQGRVWFTSVLPVCYPIPDDGPVGELLRAAGRPAIRPAHVHVRIEAPGFRRLTTMLFVDGDPQLDSDPVFGVKNSLVARFEQRAGLRAPDGAEVPDPCYAVEHDFVLAR